MKVTGLTKEYGPTKAVDNISFSITEGEVVGLLGPNGAGKTTTINMILGVLEPSGGDIEIFCKSAKENRSLVNEHLNLAAVYAQLPENLTVWENLYVFGLLYNIQDLKGRIKYLLKEFDLEKFKDQKAGVLSSGEQSRLNLAKAILNEPKLLLLDEPTASLDPSTSRLIREKIRKFVDRTGAAILWTSHNMNEIEAMCDRVLFLSHGKILLEGNPRTLPKEYNKKDLEELFIAVAREPLSLEL